MTVLRPLDSHMQRWGVLPLTFTPWVDGRFLPRHPAQLISEGSRAKVDIIAGITRDDGALFALRNYHLTNVVKDNASLVEMSVEIITSKIKYCEDFCSSCNGKETVTRGATVQF